MARLSTEDRIQDVHERALRQFDDIQSSCRDVRLQCLDDRRFCSIAGAQWEDSLGQQFVNKPRLEVNKVHLSVLRIINEYLNNRISVDFVSKDGAENEKLASVCDGLYRADEQSSEGHEAYDNGFEEAVMGGMGAWRLRPEYENEDDDDDDKQRIRLSPIFDADSSVFFDLNAKMQDKSDAKFCYVLTAMTRDAYRIEWGDDPATWPKEIQRTQFDWSTPEVVYVAEYYEIEKKKELIRIFKGLMDEEERFTQEELEEDDETLARLEATGFREVRQKQVTRKRVHKYILSGNTILEDCGYIAGPNIPIVPVYGKRWFVDNIERCMGHVRLAKDAQRLKNMQLSKLAEVSAFSSVEKPIFTAEQIAGNQVMWESDNVNNYAYLVVNPVTDKDGNLNPMGPVGYTKSPNIPPALAALMGATEQDMSDILGSQQLGEEMKQNMSGKAVELIQNRLDMQSFIYMSNMGKAVKRSGEIWLGMMKEIAVEEGRVMKAVDKEGIPSAITLRKPTIDGETGALTIENDLSKANFDLQVDVGPSSSSRRSATVRALTGMMTLTQDPETLMILSAMSIMNMEGEGLSDVQKYFRRKLVRQGVVEPNEKEAQEMQAEAANQKPDPQTEYLQAAAQESMADAEKAKADTIYTLARAEETRARTAETFSSIDSESQRRTLDALKAVQSLQSGATANQQPQS